MSPDPVTVVRHSPDGTAAAVLGALAQEPPAVVYDLTTDGGGPTQLTVVFDAVDSYLAHCSGTPLLVCTTDPSVVSVLRSHPLAARVSTWPTPDAALAVAQLLPSIDRFTIDLDPLPSAPRRMRDVVGQAMARWETPHMLGPAWSVVTELVTNAVVHAATPLTASISRPNHDHSRVRLAVRDGVSAMPMLVTPKPLLTEGGHGIRLVDRLARGWGVVPLDPGKIVWAVLDGSIAPEESDTSSG